MITPLENHEISTRQVLGGQWSTQIPLPTSGAWLQIGIPKFNIEFSAPLIELLPKFSVGEVIMKAVLDPNVTAILILTGSFNEAARTFQTERFSFILEPQPRRPHALFVSSTIMALIGLSGEMSLEIPEIKLRQTVSFETHLLHVCARLEERQLAYRAMVIELATGHNFMVPEKPTAADMGSLAFAFHAIVDNTFLWPNKQTYHGSIPANEEGRSEFSRPTVLTFKSIPIARTIFGEKVSLGDADVIIEDAVIADSDVLEELAADDSHQVPVKVRSLNGHARYDFLTAPKFTDNSWGPFLQMLIDIGPRLDLEIVERYHRLAAESLLDLTEEEKLEAVSSPHLDADGFDWEDVNEFGS